MDDGSLFIFPSQVTEEGLYDISDNFFMEWWPNIKSIKELANSGLYIRKRTV